MASLTETLTGLKNKNTDTTASAQQRYPVQFISYTCLEGSSYNFYPMTEIDDLADAVTTQAHEGIETQIQQL